MKLPNNFRRRVCQPGLLAWLALGLSWAAVGARGEVTTPAKSDAALAAAGDNSGNPYASIVLRNAFRLKDPLPPPPPPTNAAPVAETPKLDVKLAGLSQIKGVRYAYLMVPDTDRPGQFLYPALTDDPQHGAVRHGSGLEVKQIDLKNKTVRLVNGGIEATINFQDNGIKNVPTAAKPGVPPPGGPGAVNQPRAANAAVPAPGAAPGAPGAMAEPIVFSRNPNRASNGANGGNNATPAAAVSSATANAIANLNLPNRPIRTTGGGGTVSTPVSQPTVNTPATPSLPIEHQYEVLIRQKQAAEAAGISLPPIPGIPFPSDPQ